MPITKNLFLPSDSKMILPSGKVIYVSDIGNYKLRLTQNQPVQWTISDNKGNVIGKGVTQSISPEIINSFTGKSGKVYIEFDSNNRTARAELNKENFTGIELDSLPSVEQRNEWAQTKSDEAIEAQGAGIEKYIKIGIGLFAASLLIRLLK